MSGDQVRFEDVQGIVRFGYRKLTEACFLLLRVREPGAARRWLGVAPVSTAVTQPDAPKTALQLAFTADGLTVLGLPRSVLDGFSPEFLAGMAGAGSRSRLLGDVGQSAPVAWRWGTAGRVPHLLAMLYAQPGHLDDLRRTIQNELWHAAFDEIDCLSTSDLHGVEPFGFADGISEPTLDWERRRNPRGDQLRYSNLVSLGEFLLGYPNEYGRYTERPLLEASSDPAALLHVAEDTPNRLDLGRNGTYLVLRTLAQDVTGFWQFLDAQAGSEPRARQELAEAMVGRRMNGNPLLPLTTQPIAGVDEAQAAQNQFTYDIDPRGTHCPFGAHVRRANPRNADLPAPPAPGLPHLLHTLGFDISGLHKDSKASTRFHRIVRRGREYGSRLSPEQAIAAADNGERGLHFICLAANISRQFEFLQNAWFMSTKFDALTGESDPLLGNREPIAEQSLSNSFTQPRAAGLRRRVEGLPQFVTVRGGAYFFLPSLCALRYLTALP